MRYLARAPDSQEGLSIGNKGWGLDLVITYPIYACQPVEIWYNFTDADLPADQVLPDAGAVSFHTPNANQYQWMVVAPPIGTGVFSWTCPLPPGHKFVLRAVMDYEQILTVETPPGGLPKDCTEIPETGLGPEPTSTFIHGTMDIAVFESFARTKYPATSLSTEDAFGPTPYPTAASLVEAMDVPLGSRSATSRQPQTTQPQDQDTSTGSKGPNIAAIAGGVAAGVVVLLGLLGFIFVCWRRKRRRERNEMKVEPRLMDHVPVPANFSNGDSSITPSSAAVFQSSQEAPLSANERKRARFLHEQNSLSTLRTPSGTREATPSGTTSPTSGRLTHAFFSEDSFPPSSIDRGQIVETGAEDLLTIAPPRYTSVPEWLMPHPLDV